jgi:hypothetical protein
MDGSLMTGVPVLLLDVDGVINGHPDHAGWQSPAVRLPVGPVYYEPAAVDRIRRLHTAGHAEIRWATTWCGYPDELARLGRLLELDLPSAFGDRPDHKTWGDLKLEAALAVLDDGRPLIWVDDEEAAAARQLFPAIARAERLGRALLVTPVSEHGLRPHHLDSIEVFCSDHRSMSGRSLADR